MVMLLWMTASFISMAVSIAALDSDTSAKFLSFQRDYGRHYESQAEEQLRLRNFQKSLEIIRSHNSREDRTFEMGINQFSDMSDEEFEQKVLMTPQNCSATNPASSSATQHSALSTIDLPMHFDWRDRGVISEVKNQGECGSCWTFSTVGCLEAHLAIKYDNWRSPRLSEQQLVDCAQAFDNHGCEGGLPSHAFEYVRHSGGLSTEFHYPYTAKDGQCKFEHTVPGHSPDGSFRPTSAGIGVQAPGGSVNLTVGDEAGLKYHLATHGPVSVAF
jgi:cathepsin H